MHRALNHGGLKTLVVLLVLTVGAVFFAPSLAAEMRITTHDGRILKVPVAAKEIRTIEFTADEALLSIEGTWNSSIGFQYQIAQSGNAFTWNVAAPVREQGKGTISGQSINASWSGSNGSGSASGRITGIDSSQRAKRIEWSNGVVFYR